VDIIDDPRIGGGRFGILIGVHKTPGIPSSGGRVREWRRNRRRPLIFIVIERGDALQRILYRSEQFVSVVAIRRYIAERIGARS